MLSIIIPSYKDPLIHKTIDDLLEKAEGEIEIIAVLDGYWPKEPIRHHKDVWVLHLGKNRGMRDAINAGVRISHGEYIMRVDEHCMFAKGFDKVILDSIKPNWIMTARRYYLDPDKWKVMDLPCVDCERLVIQSVGDAKKFTGFPWKERKEERKDVMIDETMAMQGSFWIMPRKWWDDVIGELQSEGYGTHLQDSHEMVFKTWKAGGKLMVNKNTWFAHKHVSFPRTHNYGGKKRDESLRYSYNTWKDYYHEEIKPKWKI
jgi:glycosyltransferase involved in cell wall biosynthesis